MRLDPDGSRNPRSPHSQAHSHTNSNGSNPRSPGRGVGLLSSGTNGHSHPRTDSNGSSTQNGTAKLKRSETYRGHNREEVTRILIQSLVDLDYQEAANSLIQESGYQLEGPTVAAFRNAVLSGDWVEAETLLFGDSGAEDGGVEVTAYNKSRSRNIPDPWGTKPRRKGLTLSEDADEVEMKFLLRQQKYLELLENTDIPGALIVLRQELTPLQYDMSRLHSLSSFMMCQSPDDLRQQASWDGAQGESRKHLLSQLSKSISPSVMIPEHRLAVLLDNVKDSWIANCRYHNTAQSPSLYIDHECDSIDFPRAQIRTLAHHDDEVWVLAYSHDGTKLATADRTGTVLIYEATTYTVQRRLTGHDAGVSFLSWSPDDSKLITCSVAQDNSVRIWDVNIGESVKELTEFTYPTTGAAWAPDGETFVTGSQDTKCALVIWDKDGRHIHRWPQHDQLRINDVAISPDGQYLVALLEHAVLVYNYHTRVRERAYYYNTAKMVSVKISADSKHMLVSMSGSRIVLVNIDTGEEVETYERPHSDQYVVRSSFGGANESFVISGTEDSRIFIWRTSGDLVEKLDAHSRGCVNAVSWHPQNPLVFASAGDDHKVRIWSTTTSSLNNGSSR